ncbi:MAG: DUF2330 domain-containing protein [Polyangiales bacterium]
MANPLLLAATLACAPAPHAGEMVRIADEQAVIVWNGASKIEHFIRRARFATEAKDFGFLVPTPSKPTLAAADDRIFAKLAGATKPEERTDTGLDFEPTISCLAFMRGGAKTAAAPEAQSVKVLEVARIAGYDAAVLAADDAGALASWLDEHGYPSSPSLKSWLDLYVKAKWIVTAFKVARKDAGDVGTSAVRLTFATDKPFYPYREPDDQRTGPAGSRVLEVFLVTDARMQGAVDGAPWNVYTTYARKDVDVAPLLAGIPDVQPRAWLHRFLDLSSPRPGLHDLFFDAALPSEIVPPPIVHDGRVRVPVPLDVVVLIVVASALTVRLLRRRPT